MDKPIRVMVADDHPLVRFALDSALEATPTVSVCAHAGNPEELAALLGSTPCDVLVTDLLMPGAGGRDGIEMLEDVRRHHPDLPIVVLTVVENPQWLRRALELGVCAIVSKQDEVGCVAHAITAARDGQTYFSERVGQVIGKRGACSGAGFGPSRLSPREAQVVRLYLGGYTVTAIAAQLNRSVKTVSTQKQSAMRKLHVTNDAELFMYGMSEGLLQSSGPAGASGSDD